MFKVAKKFAKLDAISAFSILTKDTVRRTAGQVRQFSNVAVGYVDRVMSRTYRVTYREFLCTYVRRSMFDNVYLQNVIISNSVHLQDNWISFG